MNKTRNKNRNKSHAAPKNTIDPNNIWLYGKHPSFSALQKKRRKIMRILVTKNTNIELEKVLSQSGLSHLKNVVRLVESAQIESLIGRDQLHQGIAVECSKLPIKNQNDLLDELESLDQKARPTLLLLDQLSDPQNIGAIIRSAVSFGVKHIIFCDNNAPKESATMARSSVGTIEMVDITVVTNFSNLIDKLKKIGYWCIGLAGESSTDIVEIRNYDTVALIVGSEGSGIRKLVRKNCDLLTKIDIDAGVESLNASVATSIALYELSKR